ncbi:MAG TPA: hypothetical protein PKY87_06360 [Terricaulis sp.]|nr:hypothetical protein [Terricaulis sp.]
MAFDASVSAPVSAKAIPREHFIRAERLTVLLGASALGAMIGFAGALASGRLEPWALALIALPVLAFAAHLTIQTLSEAFAARAWGCAAAAGLHVAALMAWPMIALMASSSPALFWFAPGLAFAGLILFASCWEGASRAVYRVSAQGALIAAIAAQQGLGVLLG